MCKVGALLETAAALPSCQERPAANGYEHRAIYVAPLGCCGAAWIAAVFKITDAALSKILVAAVFKILVAVVFKILAAMFKILVAAMFKMVFSCRRTEPCCQQGLRRHA